MSIVGRVMTKRPKPMPAAQRQQWILYWITNRADGFVDILCSEFVESYVEVTGVKYTLLAYGAPKCRQLSADLYEMYCRGLLSRFVVSLPPGSVNEGFPAWVYSYHVRDIV